VKSGIPEPDWKALGDPPTQATSPQMPLQTLFYFDVTTEQCYPFGAQNCGGNENRFETLADCQQRCKLRN